METDLLICIDGKYYPKSHAKVSVCDHRFLYGDGKPRPITRRLMQEFERLSEIQRKEYQSINSKTP